MLMLYSVLRGFRLAVVAYKGPIGLENSENLLPGLQKIPKSGKIEHIAGQWVFWPIISFCLWYEAVHR